MFEWKEPNQAQANFPCKIFSSLIPKNIETSIKIGQIWEQVPLPQKNQYHEHLESNRYNPPEPEYRELILFKLLQMFHKRPFINTRFPPQGKNHH